MGMLEIECDGKSALQAILLQHGSDADAYKLDVLLALRHWLQVILIE
jgi:hypothetical protein